MAKVALLVGVSEYEPGLNPLPGSVKDVDAMQRVLAHPELGGFAETDITVLKNPQRQAIEDAIYTLFNDRKKDDLLLFYFSGHGIKDEKGRLYLATRATRKDGNGRLVPPSAVAATSLHDNINVSRSQRQVMILDCCFSGAIAQGMTVKDDGTVNLKDYLGGRGRAILTSSSSTEYSFGSETAGYENAGLSIYTRYLVEGIEKGAADTDGDGWIAVEELHEYAASRVKEAAPAMTPKFYPVEGGYKIVLARSRKDDPKLKYRKEAQARAEQGQGQFSIIAQRLLRGKRIEWGIAAEEAKAIEDEVLQPYREYELKQQEYEQALAEVVQAGYPLSATAEAELKEYQQYLRLRDSDIAAIETRILTAVYQQNLVQYEQTLTDAIQQEFPLNQQTRQNLGRLQQSLGLKGEDITRVEHPLIQQAELRHQEKLRYEAERQQQEKERAEYENKLWRYEQEFTKAIQAEYPLSEFVADGLKSFQQQLGLQNEDTARIEQPLEAKYREQLRRQELAEKQSQADLRQPSVIPANEDKNESVPPLESKANYDLEIHLFLTPEERNQGLQKEVELWDGRKINVKIPASVRVGQKIRVRGKGEFNQNSQEWGDLYLLVTDTHPEGGVNIFETFFTNFKKGEPEQKGELEQKRQTRGDDLRLDLKLSFREAVFGGEKEIRINHLETCVNCSGSGVKPGGRSRTCTICSGSGQIRRPTRTPFGSFTQVSVCPTCDGSGQVVEDKCNMCDYNGRKQETETLRITIPAGVDNGTRLRVASEGDAGIYGGSAGDLYVYLFVDEDKKFKRDGVNILSSVQISQAQAASGCSLNVDTIHGSASLEIPRGTKSETVLRLQNHGVPYLGNPSQRGDHLVTVNIG
jgi:DnaJ-class molecular chaperone/uncharacterized caspase-like protein